MMDTANEILDYLSALASELVRSNAKQQYHILISGGAYMMLQFRMRRSTDDIDFVSIAPGQVQPGQVFNTTLARKGEIAHRNSSSLFSQAVRSVATRRKLPADWLNDESAVYLYDDAPGAELSLWQIFSQVLYVYLPTAEYVLALKLAANRVKDEADIRALIKTLNLASRAEAQAIVDRFLLPEAQEFWQVRKNIRRFFRS